MVFEGRQGSKPAMMVLRNPELLESILQYLHTSKTTLISASLTAKAFSEPAFNVIWYEMDSLWPLFRILPAFERGTNGKYVFTGAIRNEHFQRVLYYAKRIRFLNYKDFDNSLYAEVPRDLVTSTIMRIDKLGVFIPLRKIQLCDPLRDIMLLPLTVPNLDDIEIVANTRESLAEATEIGLASFLHSIASQSSLLRSLDIRGRFGNITLQVLPDFVNLHTLRMNLHNPDIQQHFLNPFASSMPSLRVLRIAIFEFTPRDRPQKLEQPDSRSQSLFLSLETLVVHVWNNAIHLGDLFGGLDAPLLKSGTLSLFYTTPDVGAHIQRNREVLKDKIHKLILFCVDGPFILVGLFENLRELDIVSSHAIFMSDIVDTFKYGGSWSQFLTCLRVTQVTGLNGISIAALYMIANACPNLKTLEISIYDPERPEKPTVKKDGQERQPHDLEQLVFFNLPAVWDESVSLAIELILFLDHLFPSMAVPNYTGMEDALSPRKKWWKGVQELWTMFQSKRKMSSSICRCGH